MRLNYFKLSLKAYFSRLTSQTLASCDYLEPKDSGSCTLLNWIILIGGRSPALDSALALGLNVLLIAEPTTPKRVFAKANKSIAICLRSSFEQVLPEVIRLLDDIKPVAIIAASEQGVLPAAQLREYYSIAGQDVASARDALIKSEMKKRFKRADLPCWPTIAIENIEQATSLADEYGYPMVVKALASSGSRGFKIIKDRTKLRRVIKNMLVRTDYGGIGVEPLCSLKECSVELILQNGEVLFSNITDYLISSKINFLPAEFSAELTEKLLSLSLQVAAAFNFKHGMLHIEFYYDEEQLWLGEVNARPPGGGLMDLIQRAYDFDPWDLFIRCQLSEEIAPIKQIKKCYAANWVIHPGKGLVKSIEGVEAIENNSLTQQFSLKLKLGQKVYQREGTGSSVGTLTMCSKNPKKLSKAILQSIKTLQIGMTKDLENLQPNQV